MFHVACEVLMSLPLFYKIVIITFVTFGCVSNFLMILKVVILSFLTQLTVVTKLFVPSPQNGVPAVIVLDQLNCLASLADIFDVSQLEGNRNRYSPVCWMTIVIALYMHVYLYSVCTNNILFTLVL